MRIGERDIGSGHSPYVVAEISGEHRGEIANAFSLIRAAKDAGADAVKLQCFVPQRLAEARGGADKVLTEGLWKGRKLGELYLETCTPLVWFPDLFELAANIGITIFSSVFDEMDVVFLEHVQCPAYKISSFDLTNLPLIRKAASTGKPVIISTGMGDRAEINRAATASIAHGKMNVALLHCVSSYPCRIEEASLDKLCELHQHYHGSCVVGFSDHTLGNTAAIVATALGASIIEKHITLDSGNGGPDAAFSLEPVEFKIFCRRVRDAYASLGTGERPESEAPYRDLRRKA